jgi:hypothetical protein
VEGYFSKCGDAAAEVRRGGELRLAQAINVAQYWSISSQGTYANEIESNSRCKAEPRLENPCVGGSIPPRATKNIVQETPTHAGWRFRFWGS